MLQIIIIKFGRLNLPIETNFYKKNSLSVSYKAVAPNFGMVNCLNFGGYWSSDFWIFWKIVSIDLLNRSWNASYYYFFWIGEIANLSNNYGKIIGSFKINYLDSQNHQLCATRSEYLSFLKFHAVRQRKKTSGLRKPDYKLGECVAKNQIQKNKFLNTINNYL